MAQEKEKEGVPETPEQIIAKFSAKDVNEQRRSIVEYLNKFRHLTEELPLIEQIKHKVNFLQSIKHQVLTRHSGMKEFYHDASVMFNNLIESLNGIDINRISVELTGIEKLSFLNRNNNLLEKFIENLDLQRTKVGKIKEHAMDLENLIKDVKDFVLLTIGAVAEREKEGKLIGNLEEQAGIFFKKGGEYKTNSRLFLGGAGVFIGLVVLFQIYNLFCKQGSELEYIDLEQGDYLYFYVALKTLLSTSTLLSIVILVGLLVCIRFYAANNHNAIICDQRANTLKSYKALRASAKTDEERRLILQKILDSATEHQETGFSKQESNDSGNAISKIASDLVRLFKR